MVSSTLRPMARLLMVECWITPSLSMMNSPLRAMPCQKEHSDLESNVQQQNKETKRTREGRISWGWKEYLVRDQNTEGLWNWFGNIGNKWVFKIPKPTRLPVCLHPCKVGELHPKSNSDAKIWSNKDFFKKKEKKSQDYDEITVIKMYYLRLRQLTTYTYSSEYLLFTTSI